MSEPEEIIWAPNTPRPAEMTAMFEEARALVQSSALAKARGESQ